MIVEFHFIYVNVYKQDHLSSVKDNLVIFLMFVFLLFLTNCTLLLANYGSLNGTHVKNKMKLMFCETTWYLNVWIDWQLPSSEDKQFSLMGFYS